ncbi:hypothetical protein HY969_03390 [Candidatus Kaiserbacteria bacterium]|nr:hypothetical protein [Candidatus Kaiserbacteria bacterium]
MAHNEGQRRWRLFSAREILLLGAFVIVLAAAYQFDGARLPITSAETQFVERSASGLQIVPASCPSNPHGGQSCYSQSYYQGYYQSYYQGYYQSSYCTTQYQCSGDSKRVIDSCNPAGTILTCSSSQTCVNASCVSIDASLTVVPNLLRSGETTQVTWKGTNVSSCTVTEDNPGFTDSWSCNSVASCTANHTNTSSPIDAETKYTLTCTAPSGSTIIKTATVRIIPVWIEE